MKYDEEKIEKKKKDRDKGKKANKTKMGGASAPFRGYNYYQF